MLAEDWPAAERIFQDALDFCTQRSFWRAWRAQFLSLLGEVALGKSGPRRGPEYAEEAKRLSPESDVHVAVQWRRVAARALAGDGHPERALPLAEEAVAIADTGDDLVVRGGARVDLAEVQLRGGERELAERTLEEGLALLDRKGAKLPASRARQRLASLLEAGDGGARTSPGPADPELSS